MKNLNTFVGTSSRLADRLLVQEFLQKIQNAEELLALLNKNTRTEQQVLSDFLNTSDVFLKSSPKALVFTSHVLPENTRLYIASAQKLALTFLYFLWKAREQNLDFEALIAEELRQAKYFHQTRLGDFPVGADETADAMLHQVMHELRDIPAQNSPLAAPLFLEQIAFAAQGLALAKIESTVPYAPKGRVTNTHIFQNSESKIFRKKSPLPISEHLELSSSQETDPNPAITNFQESDYRKFKQGIQKIVKDIHAPLPPQSQQQKTSLFSSAATMKKSKKTLYWLSALTGTVIGGVAWASIEEVADAFFS